MSDLLLPAGVHPRDASTATEEAPVPLDGYRGPINRRPKAWSVPNAAALPVFQRIARNAAVGVYEVTTTTPTIKVAQFRPGRTNLDLWVPSTWFPAGGAASTTAAGVIIAEDEGKAQMFMGVPLMVGDALAWSSECSVWASLQPGQSSGVIAWADYWDADAQGSEM